MASSKIEVVSGLRGYKGTGAMYQKILGLKAQGPGREAWEFEIEKEFLRAWCPESMGPVAEQVAQRPVAEQVLVKAEGPEPMSCAKAMWLLDHEALVRNREVDRRMRIRRKEAEPKVVKPLVEEQIRSLEKKDLVKCPEKFRALLRAIKTRTLEFLNSKRKGTGRMAQISFQEIKDRVKAAREQTWELLKGGLKWRDRLSGMRVYYNRILRELGVRDTYGLDVQVVF